MIELNEQLALAQVPNGDALAIGVPRGQTLAVRAQGQGAELGRLGKGEIQRLPFFGPVPNTDAAMAGQHGAASVGGKADLLHVDGGSQDLGLLPEFPLRYERAVGGFLCPGAWGEESRMKESRRPQQNELFHGAFLPRTGRAKDSMIPQ